MSHYCKTTLEDTSSTDDPTGKYYNHYWHSSRDKGGSRPRHPLLTLWCKCWCRQTEDHSDACSGLGHHHSAGGAAAAPSSNRATGCTRSEGTKGKSRLEEGPSGKPEQRQARARSWPPASGRNKAPGQQAGLSRQPRPPAGSQGSPKRAV